MIRLDLLEYLQAAFSVMAWRSVDHGNRRALGQQADKLEKIRETRAGGILHRAIPCIASYGDEVKWLPLVFVDYSLDAGCAFVVTVTVKV